MSIRHDDGFPLLTPEQQGEAIHLAARLQAEHEAQASSEALLRAAEEAGIERRFLEDAAHRVATSRTLGSRPRFPVWRSIGAMLLLTVLNGLVLNEQPAEAVGLYLEGWHLALLLVTAFLASIWVGQDRRVRWAIPVGIVVLWFALAVPDAAYHALIEGRTLAFLPTLVVIVGGLQFVAALLGSFLGWYRPVRAPLDGAQSI